MKISYRSRVYEVDPADLIFRANVYWAKLDTSQRPDCKSVHYVAVPHMTDMVYTCAIDPRKYDNIIALTEILSTRDPERQKSRDLYITELYDAIADELEAA